MDLALHELGEDRTAAGIWRRRHASPRKRRKALPQGWKAISETGNRYGRLTVMERSKREVSNGATVWWCQCDCGWVVECIGSRLRYGSTRSCGCLRSELSGKRAKGASHARHNYRSGPRLLFAILTMLRKHGRHHQAETLRLHITRLVRAQRAAWARARRATKRSDS